MAKQDGRDEEIEALMNIEGVDSAKIAEQITKQGGNVTIPDDKKPDEKPPDDKKPDDKPPDDKKPEDIKPEDKKIVPDPETIKATMLNEMFGEQYKTVEDVKKANIPGALKELETLRQKNQELDALVKAKPKHQFANDDIAMMNEFVRETGIKDVGVFNKLHVSDVANMSDIDALILNHIVKNPRFANKDPQELRAYFETKYDVVDLESEQRKLEADEITQDDFNRIKKKASYSKVDLETEAETARASLTDLKGKIKMPEAPAEETPAGEVKWTPEIETQQKTAWTKVGEAMIGEFAQLPIRAKGATDPIVNFALPEDAKKSLLSDTMDYIVSNQMEVNQENVTAVGTQMYYKIKETYFEDIVQAVSERVRSMTEEEYLKLYHNPSSKNTDTPDLSGEPESDEAKREKAYQAELDG